MATTPDRFMTTEEVAALLRTKPESVRYWRHAGKGPKSFKVGKRVLYGAADVEEWMHSEGVTPAQSDHALNKPLIGSLALGRIEASLAQIARTLGSIEILLATAEGRASRVDVSLTYVEEARRPIEDLGLSMATYNAAKRQGAHTFNELCECMPGDLDHPTAIREVAKAVIGRINELPEGVMPYFASAYARWERIANQPI